MTDPWPLRHLVLRTPRLELRPDDDDGALGLVAAAERGIHPPETMPFSGPWTRADALGRNMLQFYWRCRAELAPEDWTVNFVVRADGAVICAQWLAAVWFGVLREVSTGSWLGQAHHGYGVEMRAAVLAFAFDHLGARTARSSAFADNAASRAVSRRLGYREDGTLARVRDGVAAVDVRLLVDRDGFTRPDWTLQVEGVEPCLGLLGAT